MGLNASSGSGGGFEIQAPPPSNYLKSYGELFPGYPPPAPLASRTHQDFEADAPHELRAALRRSRGTDTIMCGASLGDSGVTCGVHLFDDPKSGAPYVVPVALPTGLRAASRSDLAGGAPSEDASSLELGYVDRLLAVPFLVAYKAFMKPHRDGL
ncbi:unnamed protein product [Prorocentrum cordatum]|uniref:Uncharacterized protein n=1 Tax=Prorocentrum cordatum TaxID=2364126 RepID=A0ABN9WY85_9DINO|nr:unnamed protein product [Polarella glacialis]